MKIDNKEDSLDAGQFWYLGGSFLVFSGYFGGILGGFSENFGLGIFVNLGQAISGLCSRPGVRNFHFPVSHILGLCREGRESLNGGSQMGGLKATLCNVRTVVYNCALLSPFWAPF